MIFIAHRSYSTLSVASSRSSLASDLHDVSTPAPSSPLPPPDSSTPFPPEDQDNKQQRSSRSPTPQQPPSSSSQVQEENRETGATSTSSTTAPTIPPEISVQSAEDSTVIGGLDTTEGTAVQQLSLSEAGAQVDASVQGEGGEMKEEVGKEEEGEGEDAFGDFQGAEGVLPAAAPVTLTTALLDGDNSQAVASADAGGGEQPQSMAGISQTPGQVENTQEVEHSLSTNLTDATTNLQLTSADVVVTGT